MPFRCLLASIVSLKKKLASVIFLHPKGQCAFFSLVIFQISSFFFPLVFSSLSLMSLGVILFMFILSGTCWASGICGLMSFISFRKFLVILLEYCFHPTLFFTDTPISGKLDN